MYIWLDILQKLSKAHPLQGQTLSHGSHESKPHGGGTKVYAHNLVGLVAITVSCWESPMIISGPKDWMDQWIVPHSCHPTYLYISNKRSKRCSIRLLWLGMTVAIATGLFIVCEEILSRSSRDEPNSRKYWLPQQYYGLSFGSVVMRKCLKGVALWRAANFATAKYLGVKSGKM